MIYILKQAILFKEQLTSEMIKVSTDDFYKFYNGRSYRSYDFEVANDDWNTIQRVSIDEDGNLLGYMKCSFNRYSREAFDFGIVNFTKVPNIILSRDMLIFMDELKYSYNVDKMRWFAYKDSPADKMYRKFIKRYGGRIVGIEKRAGILEDGKYYDGVLYELLREDMKF